MPVRAWKRSTTFGKANCKSLAAASRSEATEPGPAVTPGAGPPPEGGLTLDVFPQPRDHSDIIASIQPCAQRELRRNFQVHRLIGRIPPQNWWILGHRRVGGAGRSIASDCGSRTN